MPTSHFRWPRRDRQQRSSAGKTFPNFLDWIWLRAPPPKPGVRSPCRPRQNAQRKVAEAGKQRGPRQDDAFVSEGWELVWAVFDSWCNGNSSAPEQRARRYLGISSRASALTTTTYWGDFFIHNFRRSALRV